MRLLFFQTGTFSQPFGAENLSDPVVKMAGDAHPCVFGGVEERRRQRLDPDCPNHARRGENVQG